MALLNWVTPGSYTVIEEASYSKIRREVRLVISTYYDSSKASLVAKNVLFLNGAQSTPRLLSTEATELPDLPDSVDDIYVMGPSHSFSGWVAHWSGSLSRERGGNWNFAPPDNIGTVFNVPLGAHQRWAGGTWAPAPNHFDSAAFDTHFAVGAIGGEGRDILAASYKYLKSRAEFSGVTDA